MSKFNTQPKHKAKWLYNYNDQFHFESTLSPHELDALLRNPLKCGGYVDAAHEVLENIEDVLEYALHECIKVDVPALERWALKYLKYIIDWNALKSTVATAVQGLKYIYKVVEEHAAQ